MAPQWLECFKLVLSCKTQTLIAHTGKPDNLVWCFKVPLLGLRQILAAENLFKMMKSAFYFMLKTLFVFKFLSRLFAQARKRLDMKANVNFKIYAVAEWQTNNQYTHIVQYLKK